MDDDLTAWLSRYTHLVRQGARIWLATPPLCEECDCPRASSDGLCWDCRWGVDDCFEAGWFTD